MHLARVVDHIHDGVLERRRTRVRRAASAVAREPRERRRQHALRQRQLRVALRQLPLRRLRLRFELIGLLDELRALQQFKM